MCPLVWAEAAIYVGRLQRCCTDVPTATWCVVACAWRVCAPHTHVCERAPRCSALTLSPPRLTLRDLHICGASPGIHPQHEERTQPSSSTQSSFPAWFPAY